VEEFDVAVIGAGSAGYVAAIRAADLGKRVVVVEHREIGGTCLNRGCIPTKALLKVAEAYEIVKHSKLFGISVEGISFDMAAIRKRKERIVKMLVSGIGFLFKSRKIVVKGGKGKLLDGNVVQVVSASGTEQLMAKDIIIATGSEPALIPVFKIDRKNVLTSDEALNLAELPKDILIVGAGAIGIEFATFLSAFGVKVTVVEMMPQVIPALRDKKITSLVKKLLEKRGVKVITGVKIDGIEVVRDGEVVSTLSNGEEVYTEKVLVSIGRKLNSEGLGLEGLGVKIENGRINVDTRLRTSVPNIYAVGDVVGGLLLAHKAMKEGETAAEVIAGMDRQMDYRVVPWVIFSAPEVASVGLTEEEAKEQGIDVVTGEFPFTANGKAVSMGVTDGEVKVVADANNGKIVGAQIVGPDASVMISELALAVENGLSLRDVADTIHTHPTLSEAVMEATKDALGEVIHMVKR